MQPTIGGASVNELNDFSVLSGKFPHKRHTNYRHPEPLRRRISRAYFRTRFLRLSNGWLVAWNSVIRVTLGIADDRQGESGQHGGIHRGVLGRGDRFGGRSGESLVEVQFNT